MKAQAKPQVTAGKPITYRAGSATITLHVTDTGTFVVTTEQGPRVDGWCFTYPTEKAARAAARHAAKAFKAHGTEAAIDARRAELAAAIAEQDRRAVRRMHDQAALDAAHAEYDTLMALGDLALLADLRTGLDTL